MLNDCKALVYLSLTIYSYTAPSVLEWFMFVCSNIITCHLMTK